MKTAIEQHTAKPLMPRVITLAGFLGGSRGEEFLREYKDRINKTYGGKARSTLDVFQYNPETGLIQGPNLFSIVKANPILNQNGSRKSWTATHAELENALRTGAVDLKGNYEISGLVLRSNNDSYAPNDYLAKVLYKELKRRLGRKLELPVMISARDLTLKEDPQSEYGLSFKLTDSAKPIYAPVLNQPASSIRFDSTKIDGNSGLPTEVGEGDRLLLTRPTGVSGVFLYTDLNTLSGWLRMSFSGGFGRVVVCDEVAVDEKIEQELQAEYKRRITEIEDLRRKVREVQNRAKRASEILEEKL